MNKQQDGTLNCRCYDSSVYKLQQLIIQHSKEKTGFILQASRYYITCIFHKKANSTDFYVIMINDNGTFKLFEKVCKVDLLINQLLSIVTDNEPKDIATVQYSIIFVTCLTNLSNLVRANILKKHKCNAKKQIIAEKRKAEYENLEPSKKKQKLVNMRMNSKK